MQEKRHQKLYGKSSYFNCCKCHALLGFGVGVSSRLLGKDKSPVADGIRASGIKRYIPQGGSWQVSAAILRRKEKAWQDAWMDEYDFKFPEWKKSDFFSQYDLMSDEERKVKNRKNIEARQSCPLRLQSYKDNSKKWRQQNKEDLRAKHKEWMKSDKGKELHRKYRKYPFNKIKHNLRRRMSDFLKKARAEKVSVSRLIGCSSLEFKQHIEKQFRRGMTWDNYGTHWHVDHILPCASFDHTNKKQIAQCWHYTNLRPLRAMENMLKSDTITEPQMMLLI